MNHVRDLDHFAYVLRNPESEKWYIGCTEDLRKRLAEHQNGKATYTKHRGPFSLMYYEACPNVDDAYARERYLKSGMGRRYLNNRLKRFLSLT